MSLESGTYISDLVPSNPAGGDDKSQGDDHIRLIKSTLKNTFPNVNGPVTVTDEQLNLIADRMVPVALISMWSGTIATIPSGWKLCNGVGTCSNGIPVPNLSSRFIIGSITDSGGTYNIGNTGGSKDQVVTGYTEGTALSIAQIPSHSHTIWRGTAIGNGNFGGASGDNLVFDGQSGAQGGGTAHDHYISLTSVNGNLPPYYALAFIIKN
jgi:microcystin-dependent protein